MSRLGDVIRAKIEAGVLPRERPEKLFAGYGRDEPCTACEAPILSTQVEWSIWMDDHPTHRFHIGCHGLWDAELRSGRVVSSEALCLPCLSQAGKVSFDLAASILMDLEKVVKRIVQGTCPGCGESRPLIRL
jgi:hypothetical protein